MYPGSVCLHVSVFFECEWLRVLYFFFFKQKTAYDMRISDWSSDVCSSDLKYHQVVPFGRLAEIDPVFAEIAIVRPPADQHWEHSHRIVALGGFIGAGMVALAGTATVAFGQPLGGIAIAVAPLIAAGDRKSTRLNSSH